jgi:hypothetical protein
MLPAAWSAVGPQLVGTLTRKVLAAGQPAAVTAAGLRLARALAVHHPAVLNGASSGGTVATTSTTTTATTTTTTSASDSAVQELLVALLQCAAGAPALVSKVAYDAVDALLDVAPAPAAVACLTARLQAAVGTGGGPLLCSLCTGMQRALARLSRPGCGVDVGTAGPAAALPAALLPLLRGCAEDELLEVRKAAIYALAQLRLTVGDNRCGCGCGITGGCC